MKLRYTKSAIDAVIAVECERVAAWMLANGFATGHGETTDDLLHELARQVDELREKRFEETLRRSDGGAR